MTRVELAGELAANLGKTIRMRLTSSLVEVMVIAVDVDGVLCRGVSVPEGEAGSEFWVAYNDIQAIEKV
jgi:hypothetical protein